VETVVVGFELGPRWARARHLGSKVVAPVAQVAPVATAEDVTH
jgi:hypothetical protein